MRLGWNEGLVSADVGCPSLQQARTAGEVETLKTDLKSKQAELKEEYFDIDKRYKIELIRVKVSPRG